MFPYLSTEPLIHRCIAIFQYINELFDPQAYKQYIHVMRDEILSMDKKSFKRVRLVMKARRHVRLAMQGVLRLLGYDKQLLQVELSTKT